MPPFFLISATNHLKYFKASGGHFHWLYCDHYKTSLVCILGKRITSTNWNSNSSHSLIPASKISMLTQGMFVGVVSDNFDERIEQKIFHAEIVVDNDKVVAETKTYKKIPQILSFADENGADNMKQEIESNYKQVKWILCRLSKANWNASRMTQTYNI